MRPVVRIFGGGIAGLTVAHELACRGRHKVIIHERLRQMGGKARSQFFSVDDELPWIPGEHGFRFFPGWYVHLSELLTRIPQSPTQTTMAGARFGYSLPVVSDHFTEIRDTWVWSRNQPPVRARHIPHRIGDFRAFVSSLGALVPGITLLDRAALFRTFLRELRIFYSTDPTHRHRLFDHRSLAEFVQASKLSDRLKTALRRVPKSLVAMDAFHGSAVTFLNTAMLNLSPAWRADLPNDRVLEGPTSSCWIDPWVESLRHLGVQFANPAESEISAVEFSDSKVQSVILSTGQRLLADDFVLALPLNELKGIVRRSGLAKVGPDFHRISELSLRRHSGWMVGLQLALRKPIKSLAGHVFWIDSAYGLTGVSQLELWNSRFVQSLAHRGIQGLLSLIITQWDTVDSAEENLQYPFPSALTSKEKLVQQVLAQLQNYPTADGRPLITADDVISAHVDDDLSADLKSCRSAMSVHPPGSWKLRPRPQSSLPNLFFAGEFVRNPVDLATMEGACTSAKLVARSLLSRAGIDSYPLAVRDVVSEFEPSWMTKRRKRLNAVRERWPWEEVDKY